MNRYGFKHNERNLDSRRVTMHIDPRIKKALCAYCASNDKSISGVVAECTKNFLIKEGYLRND